MSQIAKDYTSGALRGWVGYEEELAHYHTLSAMGLIRSFDLIGQTRATAGRKAMLYEVARKVLGHDIPNVPQQIGDCIAHGMKHAVEYVTCVEKANGRGLKYRPAFAPYYYGTGRVYVGNVRRGSGDGSSGAWMAAAVQKYGTLFEDEPGVPKYSGAVAKLWGDPSGKSNLDRWRDTADDYLVKSVALIRSWDDLVTAITNGYPCTTASDVGYSMLPGRDGFHAQTDKWSHQMMFCAVDETYSEPYAIILNNWGDVHGHLKDFQTGDDLPVGVLRVRRKDAEKHIRQGMTYAISQFDGFPEQDVLDRGGFSLV